MIEYVSIPGHRAKLESLYPGMGNPTENYITCSCGWSGITVIEWTPAHRFFPKIVNGAVIRDANNYIVPSSFDGTIADARAQMLQHLNFPIDDLEQEVAGELKSTYVLLSQASKDGDFDKVKQLFNNLKILNKKNNMYKIYAELKTQSIVANEYVTSANQVAMATVASNRGWRLND